MHQLGQCLVDIDGRPDNRHLSVQHMHQWRIELTALFACFCTGSPKAKADLLSLNMTDGTLHEEPAQVSHDLLVRLTSTQLQSEL